MSTVEVLRKTKEVLKVYGRTRGQNFSPNGGMCLHGAILVATGAYDPAGNHLNSAGTYTSREQTLEALADTGVMMRDVGDDSLPFEPVDFNDDPRVTDEMIYDLIDKTIERLESGS